MSCTSFRVNPYSIFCLNVKELLARNRRHIWNLISQFGLSVRLRTKWLWVRIPLLSLKVQAIIECRLTLKRVRDMIVAYSLYIIVFFLDIKGSPQTRHLNKAPRLRTGTLWVYGDCYAFHFFEAIENSTLCKKKFFVCNKYVNN